MLSSDAISTQAIMLLLSAFFDIACVRHLFMSVPLLVLRVLSSLHRPVVLVGRR